MTDLPFTGPRDVTPMRSSAHPRTSVSAPGTLIEWMSATDASPDLVWPRVRWSLAYAALLVYLSVIVTYEFRIGDFAMGAALIGLAFEPKGVRTPPFWILLMTWVIWCAIGWTASPWAGEVYEPLEVMWKLTLIALVVVSVLNDRSRVRMFMLAFVLFFAAYPARGALFNYFIGGYSLEGRAIWNHIYSNPNDLGALSLLQLSMASGLLVGERNQLIRKAALVAVVVLAFLILLTGSRGVFVGLFTFGIFVFMGERRKVRLVAILGIVAISSILLVPQSSWDRFGMLSTLGTEGTAAFEDIEDDGSAEQRFEIWKTAARIIRDNPMTGVGLGAYNSANDLYSPHLGRRDAHSTYLRVLAENGIPGFLMFIGMIAAVVIPAERVRRRIKRIRPRSAQQIFLLELGLMAFLAAGIFGSYAKLTFLYLHLALIWALATAHADELKKVQEAAARTPELV